MELRNELEVKCCVGSSKTGFKNFSISVKFENVVSIVGDNGSGKTSILDCICKIVNGTALLNNRSIEIKDVAYFQGNMSEEEHYSMLKTVKKKEVVLIDEYSEEVEHKTIVFKTSLEQKKIIIVASVSEIKYSSIKVYMGEVLKLKKKELKHIDEILPKNNRCREFADVLEINESLLHKIKLLSVPINFIIPIASKYFNKIGINKFSECSNGQIFALISIGALIKGNYVKCSRNTSINIGKQMRTIISRFGVIKLLK